MIKKIRLHRSKWYHGPDSDHLISDDRCKVCAYGVYKLSQGETLGDLVHFDAGYPGVGTWIEKLYEANFKSDEKKIIKIFAKRGIKFRFLEG